MDCSQRGMEMKKAICVMCLSLIACEGDRGLIMGDEGVGSDTLPGGSDVDSDTDDFISDFDSDFPSETETEKEFEAGTETDTETDTGIEEEGGSEVEEGTEGEETEENVETDSVVEFETDTGPEADTGPELDTETDTGPEPDTETETETGPEVDTETEAETDTRPWCPEGSSCQSEAEGRCDEWDVEMHGVWERRDEFRCDYDTTCCRYLYSEEPDTDTGEEEEETDTGPTNCDMAFGLHCIKWPEGITCEMTGGVSHPEFDDTCPVAHGCCDIAG